MTVIALDKKSFARAEHDRGHREVASGVATV